MKYQHILSYVYSTPWAMLPAKMHELISVLEYRATGHQFTAEEIRARIGDGGGTPAASKQGNVVLIPVHGVIAHHMNSMAESSGGTSCERIGAMIDLVAADPNIPTILYSFDTPGGTVTGVQELADKMFALRGRKKQIAMIDGMAASAGYWLASQCDEIVCLPTGQAGSIGVLWPPHLNISGSLEKAGDEVTMISAGKYKTEWNPYERPSEEAKAEKKAQADVFYQMFLKHVARGRDVTPGAVENGYGQGRMLFAKAAKAANLIDRIATMDEVMGKLVGRRVGDGVRAAADGAGSPGDGASELLTLEDDGRRLL